MTRKPPTNSWNSLKTSGYQVDLATSGNEALSRGATGGYAVITIDRMLPDIDGIASCVGSVTMASSHPS